MTNAELGTLLRERLAGLKVKYPSQQALAMSWHLDYGESKLGLSTVESRLSELFNGKLDGLKFFFGQRDRSTVLLRLLEVSTAEMEQIYASAELALAGQLDARTLVDLRSLTEAEIQLAWKWIEAEVLLHAGLLPMVLLVLPSQVRQIPRGFDDYRDKGQLTWTEEVGKAAERATVLLAPTPWAVGADRQVWPWQKWAQLAFVRGKVQLDPLNGLEQLAERGAIAAPSTANRDLAGIHGQADAAGADAWLKAQGAAWRSAAEQLVLRAEPEAARAVLPAVRLAMADRLGLVAKATASEVVEQEIAAVLATIGAQTVENWSETELKLRLEKARSRPQGPVVGRVGDTLHAINWPGCAGTESHGRLVVYAIEAPIPAIDAVRARLVELAGPDLAVSTDLVALVDELEEAGHQRQALRHACATLYIRDELRAGPEVVYDREVAPDERGESDRALALAVLSGPFEDPCIVVATAKRGIAFLDRVDRLDVIGPGGCVIARNGGEVRVQRDDHLAQFDDYEVQYAATRWQTDSNPWFAIQQFKGGLDGSQWLDCYDDWRARKSDFCPVQWKAYRKAAVVVDWPELDAFCAMLQVNLRCSLEAGRWHELRWRQYLVPLGSGISALVRVEEGVRPKESMTIHALGMVAPNGTVQPSWRILPLIGGDANCGPRLLEQVSFAAGTTHLHVRFHADPFSASGPQAWPAVVAKVKADAAEKARQDAYYQDDDD